MTAFRESIEAMVPALRRYARALMLNADLADDLVQDTLASFQRTVACEVLESRDWRKRCSLSRARLRVQQDDPVRIFGCECSSSDSCSLMNTFQQLASQHPSHRYFFR